MRTDPKDLSRTQLVALIDVAVDALKQIAEHYHERPTYGTVRPETPHDETKCRTCIANNARQRIALQLEEVPF